MASSYTYAVYIGVIERNEVLSIWAWRGTNHSSVSKDQIELQTIYIGNEGKGNEGKRQGGCQDPREVVQRKDAVFAQPQALLPVLPCGRCRRLEAHNHS
jgi:hypothetical protein